MSWAGCYSLDLYCDNAAPYSDPKHAYGEFSHQYSHELGSVCRSNARKAGWIIKSDGTAICPRCSGKRATPLPTHPQQENRNG